MCIWQNFPLRSPTFVFPPKIHVQIQGFSTADVVMDYYYYCVTFCLYTLKINSVLLDVQIIFYFTSNLEVFDVCIASKSTDQAQLFCTLFAPVVFVARVT